MNLTQNTSILSTFYTDNAKYLRNNVSNYIDTNTQLVYLLDQPTISTQVIKLISNNNRYICFFDYYYSPPLFSVFEQYLNSENTYDLGRRIWSTDFGSANANNTAKNIVSYRNINSNDVTQNLLVNLTVNSNQININIATKQTSITVSNYYFINNTYANPTLLLTNAGELVLCDFGISQYVYQIFTNQFSNYSQGQTDFYTPPYIAATTTYPANGLVNLLTLSGINVNNYLAANARDGINTSYTYKAIHVVDTSNNKMINNTVLTSSNGRYSLDIINGDLKIHAIYGGQKDLNNPIYNSNQSTTNNNIIDLINKINAGNTKLNADGTPYAPYYRWGGQTNPMGINFVNGGWAGQGPMSIPYIGEGNYDCTAILTDFGELWLTSSLYARRNVVYKVNVNVNNYNMAFSNIASANIAGSNIASANIAGSNMASANIAGSNMASANILASTNATTTEKSLTDKIKEMFNNSDNKLVIVGGICCCICCIIVIIILLSLL